jgi:hypothetical protein
LAGLAVLLAGLAISCDFNEYNIVMTPQGRGVQREITVGRTSGGSQPSYTELPPEEIALVGQAYGASQPASKPGQTRFVGRFAGSLPSDVGGSGSVLNIETTLGSAFFYVERFRGNPDVDGELQRRLKAADRLSEILLAFVRRELSGKPELAKAEAFLKDRFPKDLRNLLIYEWLAETQAQCKAESDTNGPLTDMMAHAAQYLIDRGYATVDDLPPLYRLASGESDASEMAVLARLAANVLGYPRDQAVPQWVAELFSDDSWKSFDEFVRATPQYRDAIAEADAEGQTAVPEEVRATQVLLPLNTLGLGRTNDRINISLACATRPSIGNPTTRGGGDLNWQLSVPPRGHARHSFPAIAYAICLQPNEQFQTRHFGRVFLAGWDLAAYALWRDTLSKSEAAKWDALLQRVKPDDLSPLRQLAEAATQPDQTGKPSRLKAMAQELLNQLEPPNSQPAE